MKFVVFALALAIALCASTTATAAAVTIPDRGLVKVHRKNVQMYAQDHKEHHKNRLQFMLAKTKGQTPVVLHTSQILYFCELEIGTPSQKVFLDIDTGSSDLWFTTKTRHHSCANCTGPKAFDSTKSSTFVPWANVFEIAFADTTRAKGFLAVDAVSWGGIKIQDQTFGAIESTNATGSEYNGLVGLGMISLSAGSIPAFYNLWNQKLIKNPYFGLYLPRFNSQHDNAGELMLGGVNSQRFQGKLKWYPSVDQFFYDVGLSAVSVDGKSIALKARATIDSGTTLAYFPSKVLHNLFDGKPGVTLCQNDPICSGYYTFQCKQPPSFKVSVYFGKDKYDINPVDLNGGPIDNKGERCLFAIGDSGAGNIWFLGDTFMRNYYTAFSPITKMIGFAKLRTGGVYF